MKIPYKTPIKIEEWQKLIKADTEKVREKGMVVTGILMNPNTVVEIMNWKHENEPMSTFSFGADYFANYKLLGNPDIEQYEYRLEIGYVE